MPPSQHHQRLNAPLYPYPLALDDEQEVLRFLVTRLVLEPSARTTGRAIALLYTQWAEANELPALGYSDLMRLIGQLVAHAPGSTGVSIVHGPTTIINGLSVRRDGKGRSTPTLPPAPPAGYAQRIAKAGASMGNFAPATASDDQLTLKFIELFTRPGHLDRLTQAHVVGAYQMWAALTGAPADRANRLWVGVCQFAQAFLNATPHLGAPLRGLALL